MVKQRRNKQMGWARGNSSIGALIISFWLHFVGKAPFALHLLHLLWVCCQQPTTPLLFLFLFVRTCFREDLRNTFYNVLIFPDRSYKLQQVNKDDFLCQVRYVDLWNTPNWGDFPRPRSLSYPEVMLSDVFYHSERVLKCGHTRKHRWSAGTFKMSPREVCRIVT